MRFITAIGQRWKRAAGASFTLALLAAVAVVGLTFFSSKTLTACKAAGNAEQALASGNSLGLLNFDAPEAKVAQFKAKKAEESELVKNWKFTDNPLLDSILAVNTFFDFKLVTDPSAPQSLTPSISFSYNQINTPAFTPFAAQIALSGGLSFWGTFIGQDYMPFVNVVLGSNPALHGFLHVFDAAVVSYVNLLIRTQAALNAVIPPAFRPPAIPPASPSF
ncbi:MAG: hypothetical protein ACYC3I_22090 [Gemmataceae bacterium]